jgi:hypothetical protein
MLYGPAHRPDQTRRERLARRELCPRADYDPEARASRGMGAYHGPTPQMRHESRIARQEPTICFGNTFL